MRNLNHHLKYTCCTARDTTYDTTHGNAKLMRRTTTWNDIRQMNVEMLRIFTVVCRVCSTACRGKYRVSRRDVVSHCRIGSRVTLACLYRVSRLKLSLAFQGWGWTPIPTLDTTHNDWKSQWLTSLYRVNVEEITRAIVKLKFIKNATHPAIRVDLSSVYLCPT